MKVIIARNCSQYVGRIGAGGAGGKTILFIQLTDEPIALPDALSIPITASQNCCTAPGGVITTGTGDIEGHGVKERTQFVVFATWLHACDAASAIALPACAAAVEREL